MKNIVKSLINILRYFLRFITSKHSFIYNRLPIARDEQLHILANGPSLNLELQHLNYKQLNYFVVNGFANSELYLSLRPKYYALVDPLYWDNSITNSDMEKEREVLDKILENTDWNMFLFVPQKGKLFLTDYFNTNKNINIYGYNDLELETHWTNLNHWFYSKNLATIHFQNVLAASIFLGINMKYSKIFLYGTNHSWIKNIALNKNNEVCIKHEHFYDDLDEKLVPWMSNNGTIYKMHEILFDLHNIFKGYDKLKVYAESQKTTILNQTKDSYIDAFKKNN
jgi:hypothetical protein